MKILIGLLAVVGLTVWMLADSSVPARSAAPAGAGSKIAFTRTENPLPGTEESNQGEIWVMNGDGTGQRRLTCNDTFDLGAVWSPDGKTIAFYGYDVDNAAAGAHVYFIPADDGDCTDQTPLNVDMQSRFPSWSVSGKIAFDDSTGPTSGSDIWVVNPDGSGLQDLTNDPAVRNIRPDWSPDGRKIVFVKQGVIDVMNADGTDQTPLTSGGAPAWSPTGQQIVFQRAVGGGNTEIYTMNADGTDQTPLTTKLLNGQVQRNQDPDWSPDGRQIAFMRDDATQTFQVFVMNADGSDQRPLTELPSENSHPGWRPLETSGSQ
jgi:TolB protein